MIQSLCFPALDITLRRFFSWPVNVKFPCSLALACTARPVRSRTAPSDSCLGCAKPNSGRPMQNTVSKPRIVSSWHLLCPRVATVMASCGFQVFLDVCSYHMLPHVTTCYHMLPHVTTCYHMLPHVTTCYHMLPHVTTCYHMLPHVTTCYHMLPHVTTPFKDIYLSRNMMAWLAWPPFQQLFRTSYGHNVLLAGSSQMKRLFQRAIMIYHVGGIFQHILNAQFHDQFEKSDQSHQCPAFIHCILRSWSVVNTCEYFRKPYRKKDAVASQNGPWCVPQGSSRDQVLTSDPPQELSIPAIRWELVVRRQDKAR